MDPRDLNSAADDISKFIDYDFNSLDDLWDPCTCDRFACSYNAKIQCVNSRFYQPSSSGVNAFSQDSGLIIITGCAPLCI